MRQEWNPDTLPFAFMGSDEYLGRSANEATVP